MNLVKRNHSNNFPTVMDEFFKDWVGGSQLQFKQVPPVNVKETEKAFSVELVAPGLKKEDFNIAIEQGTLIISSERKEESSKEEKNYSRKEFSYTSFSRSFQLPENTDENNIDAKYNNGVLQLTIPKKEIAAAKPKKQIKIS